MILCVLKGEMPFKMHKIIKEKCVPTLPNIFRPLTRNTLFSFGLAHLVNIFVIHHICVTCKNHIKGARALRG